MSSGKIDAMHKNIALLCMMILLSSCGPSGRRESSPGGSVTLPVNEAQPALPTTLPTPILPPTLSGDVEVQELMLTSHQRWQTLQVSYAITHFPLSGSQDQPQVQTSQLWIRLPAEFKVLTGPLQASPQGGPVTTRVSDGVQIVDSDGIRSEMPPSVFEPFNPPDYPSDTVYLHPLAGFLGTPVSDLVFPAGLAQRGGEYRISGRELVAGRQTQVVEWGREPGVLIDRFWVDSQTGVVLRQQNYGKDSAISPQIDIQATHVVFDGEIPPDAFEIGQVPTPQPTQAAPAPGTASVTVLEIAGVLNVRSGPNTDYKVVIQLQPGVSLPVIGKNEAGDWWKVELEDGQVGWVFGAYVEFSGDAEDVPLLNY